MDNVHYKTDKSFPFEKITLMTPRSMQGGAFFSKILLENGIPLLFQTPKCLTKNGIIKTGKKTYCDLKLDETHEMFIQWFQTFEKKLHALIFEKKDQWFHNDMTLDDIEYLFNSCIRTYKTKNFLIRCFVKQPKYIKSKNNLQIYDEEENLLQLEDITNEKKIISIIEVLGIKFTNGGASFHLELCMRQLMAFSNKPIFQKCLIHFDNHLEKNREKEKSIEEETIENEEDIKDEKDEQQEEGEIEEPEQKKEEAIEVYKDNKETKTNDIKKEEEALVEIKKELPNEKKNTSLPKLVSKDSLDDLNEVILKIDEKEKTMSLKKPKDVYYKMWKDARKRAKEAKQLAIQAYLEAKKIKNTYLLDEMIESDDDDLDNLSESEELK